MFFSFEVAAACFPKIHLVSYYVWFADPAGQQVSVHQIHLMLRRDFSTLEEPSVCTFLIKGMKRRRRQQFWVSCMALHL